MLEGRLEYEKKSRNNFDCVGSYNYDWKIFYNDGTNIYNAKITAVLMDTRKWSGFAESPKVKALTNQQNQLVAIGGIPVEMFIKSWNDQYNNKLEIYYNSTSSTGYYIETDGDIRFKLVRNIFKQW